MSDSHLPTQKSKFRSISSLLFLSFLGLSLVILLIEGGVSLYTNFRSEESFISFEQKNIAEDAGDIVKNYIETKFNIMDITATTTNIEKQSPQEQEIIMTKLMQKDPSFMQIVLYNMKKERVARVTRHSSIYTHSIDEQFDKDLLPHVIEGEFHASNSYYDLDTSEPLILLAIPIKDVFGDIKNVLVAEVNLKNMWDVISKISVGKNGIVYVVDDAGTLLAFKDSSLVLKRENLKHLKEVREFMAGQYDHKEHKSGLSKGIYGTSVVSTFYDLRSEPRWAIIIEEPVFDAYRTVIEEVVRLVIIIFVTFLLAIVLSIFLSKRITRPIISLSAAAEKMSAGDLNTSIEVTSSDEIGQLGEAFNEMTKQLKESYGALEQKVKDKTAELEAKMNESERMNKLMVGRELKMIELKKEIEKLEQELEKSKSQT